MQPGCINPFENPGLAKLRRPVQMKSSSRRSKCYSEVQSFLRPIVDRIQTVQDIKHVQRVFEKLKDDLTYGRGHIFDPEIWLQQQQPGCKRKKNAKWY